MVNQITKMIKIMKIMRQAFLNGTFPSHPLAMCPTPVGFHNESRDHQLSYSPMTRISESDLELEVWQLELEGSRVPARVQTPDSDEL